MTTRLGFTHSIKISLLQIQISILTDTDICTLLKIQISLIEMQISVIDIEMSVTEKPISIFEISIFDHNKDICI